MTATAEDPQRAGTYIAAIQPIADPSGSATATLGTAISAFLAAQYLSAKVNTQ